MKRSIFILFILTSFLLTSSASAQIVTETPDTVKVVCEEIMGGTWKKYLKTSPGFKELIKLDKTAKAALFNKKESFSCFGGTTTSPDDNQVKIEYYLWFDEESVSAMLGTMTFDTRAVRDHEFSVLVADVAGLGKKIGENKFLVLGGEKIFRVSFHKDKSNNNRLKILVAAWVEPEVDIPDFIFYDPRKYFGDLIS